MPTDSRRTDLWRSLWLLRVVWFVAPFAIGPALAESLDGRDGIATVASGLAWLGWAIVLIATLVPRSSSLTVVRMVAPGAVPIAIWAAVVSGESALGALAVVAALVAASVALIGPGVADAFVDGSSYGDEQRVALRVPLSLLALPVPLAWSSAAAGACTGPLLLGARLWIPGAVATIVGAGIVVGVGRRLHVLSCRWLVFVPAGVVLHDPLHLSEPILLPKRTLKRFGPVSDAGDAADVTGHALGLVLELRPSEPIDVGFRRGRDASEDETVTALLVAPTRPGATLTIARERRLIP